MKGQYYVVFLRPDPAVSSEAIKEAMNKALDWYRAGSTFWIVYTKRDADGLYRRLKPLVNDKGRIFVAKLDLEDRQGWMEKGFWEWIKKARD